MDDKKFSFKKIKASMKKAKPDHTASDDDIKKFVNTLNNIKAVSSSEEEFDMTVKDAFKLVEKSKK